MPKKILVVDDEKSIVDIIAYNLRKEGYETASAHDGEEGLRLAMSNDYALILLDIMMPKRDGFEVCRAIREKSQVPIIMLTARAEEVDKVLGLELGADDYVTKPFGVRELMARVKANIRRKDISVAAAAGPSEELRFGELVVDLKKVEIRRRNEVLNLTHREYELTKFLAVNSGQVFTREELLEKVWGYEFYGDELRTVDVTVRRLRSKLEDNPETPRYIMTRRGVGYYFEG